MLKKYIKDKVIKKNPLISRPTIFVHIKDPRKVIIYIKFLKKMYFIDKHHKIFCENIITGLENITFVVTKLVRFLFEFFF